MNVVNRCRDCGTEISEPEIFPEEDTHCRCYCCGCCPSKNGYRGELCQMNYNKRQRGEPVGFLESVKE